MHVLHGLPGTTCARHKQVCAGVDLSGLPKLHPMGEARYGLRSTPRKSVQLPFLG